MSIKSKLEKLLGQLYNAGFYDGQDGKIHDRDKPISKISQAILAEFERMIPEKKEMPSHYDLCLLSNEDRASEEGEIQGYNQAIFDMKAKLEKEK